MLVTLHTQNVQTRSTVLFVIKLGAPPHRAIDLEASDEEDTDEGHVCGRPRAHRIDRSK